MEKGSSARGRRVREGEGGAGGLGILLVWGPIQGAVGSPLPEVGSAAPDGLPTFLHWGCSHWLWAHLGCGPTAGCLQCQACHEAGQLARLGALAEAACNRGDAAALGNCRQGLARDTHGNRWHALPGSAWPQLACSKAACLAHGSEKFAALIVMLAQKLPELRSLCGKKGQPQHQVQ